MIQNEYYIVNMHHDTSVKERLLIFAVWKGLFVLDAIIWLKKNGNNTEQSYSPNNENKYEQWTSTQTSTDFMIE